MVQRYSLDVVPKRRKVFHTSGHDDSLASVPDPRLPLFKIWRLGFGNPEHWLRLRRLLQLINIWFVLRRVRSFSIGKHWKLTFWRMSGPQSWHISPPTAVSKACKKGLQNGRLINGPFEVSKTSTLGTHSVNPAPCPQSSTGKHWKLTFRHRSHRLVPIMDLSTIPHRRQVVLLWHIRPCRFLFTYGSFHLLTLPCPLPWDECHDMFNRLMRLTRSRCTLLTRSPPSRLRAIAPTVRW